MNLRGYICLPCTFSILFFAFLLTCGMPARAGESTAASGEISGSTEPSDTSLHLKGDSPESDDISAAPEKLRLREEPEKGSFMFVCTSNYHMKLKTSEDQVNSMLNRPMGLLLPRWKEPETFKDWMDKFQIWDLSIGYGRDATRTISWTVYGGGGMGTIPNSHRYYPLGIPLKISADFTRKSILAGSSVVWHPIGRPVLTRRGIIRSLKQTKPMLEFDIGYTYQESIAKVKFNMPLFGDVITVNQKDIYHLMWVSPRAGVEIPLTKRNSINILAGYLWFRPMADEYNGWMLECYVRHRF